MPSRSVYLDNASTSFPKAPGVAEAVYSYLSKIGSNINRGTYSQALQAEDIVYETRELLGELFSYSKPEYIVFTKNITESLNLLLKGLLKPNKHVLISSMEHNAVIRPLNHLRSEFGNTLEISILSCNESGELPEGKHLVEALEKNIQANTIAVIMTHASNVCGTILPIEQIGAFCRKHNLFFLIDTAQTAGFELLNFQKCGADALAFTGHKGLLGPQGIGGLILGDRLASRLEPLITGGTGSSSEEEFQPSFMPDRFEAGTLNIPGIYGLNASLKYLKKTGIVRIKQTELQLIDRFIRNIKAIRGVELIGKHTLTNRTAVISLDFTGMDNALVSHRLSSVYGITNRTGLHCSPLAHKTLKTYPQGTVRLSFSHFNTSDEVDYSLQAIEECLSFYR